MKTYLFPLLALAHIFCQAAACKADDLVINATNPQSWSPAQLTVKPGDVVTWKVAQGKHGLTFENFEDAKKILIIESESKPIAPHTPTFPPQSQGTDAFQGVDILLVKATVKAASEIPAGMTEVKFMCTQHPHMTGKLTVTLPAAGGPGNP